MVAAGCDSQIGDGEDVESFASSLLQSSLRLNISRRLVEDVHPHFPACHWEYAFFFMILGILAITTLFVGLGWCARTDAQMLAGEAEQPMKPMGHLGSIDGLRTIFTIWIVLFHEMQHLIPVLHVLNATAAMQFFFVVSGFVNVKATETNVIAFSLKSGLRFIQRRIARLFPLLWCSNLLWAIVLKLTHNERPLCVLPWRWLVEATAMCEVLPSHLAKGASHLAKGAEPNTWFVSTLFVLNLCFPMLYNMSPSRPAAIACLIIMLIVVRSLFLIFPVPGDIPFLHYDNVAPRLFEFFTGMLSAAWCRQMQSHGSWSGWGCVFDASIMLAFLVIPIDHHATSGDFGLTGVWCMTCISASFAAEAPSHVSPNPGVWPRSGLFGIILNCGPMQLLARYTYSIYVMQAPVSYALLFWWPGLLFDRFMTVLITILIGVLAEVAIDQPVQRVFGRFIRDGFVGVIAPCRPMMPW